MEFNWIEMWGAMSPLAKGVAVALMVMGLLSFAIFIERGLMLYRHRKSSKEFIKNAEPFLKLQNPKYEAVHKLSTEFSSSYAAKVVGKGVKYYLADKNTEKVTRKLERYFESMAHDMRRGMTILSTTGSVAPFVGLLGTVIGIVSSFRGIAKSGSGGLNAVSAGISEALVETALGLFVAIPAVMIFYFLSAQIDKEETTLKAIAGELIEKMEDSAANGSKSADDELIAKLEKSVAK